MSCLHFVSLPAHHPDYSLLADSLTDTDAIILMGSALAPDNPCLEWSCRLYSWSPDNQNLPKGTMLQPINAGEVVQLVMHHDKSISWLDSSTHK